MSDPRRRRHINVPTGPKKKPESDASSYKMSRPAEGRKEIPKPKPQQHTEARKMSSGDQRQQKKGQQRSRGQTSQPMRGRTMPRQQRPERPIALKSESWGRVIEHDVNEDIVTGFAEKSFTFFRVKVRSQATPMIPNQRFYIGTKPELQQDMIAILGIAHLNKMSNSARQDLPLAIQLFVEEHADHFLNEFYNRAGNLSLKQHAFELLAGIGNKKARQMVEARGQSGFESMQAMNEACSIDGAELLANRFAAELEDTQLNPRLVELLLPVKE